MIEILLPLGLAFIMFSLGLSLKVADFKRAFSRPMALFLGLIAQVLLLPLTAFLIATALSLSATAAVGLMILAACPGGVTAGMVTYFARGETALSISLSAMTSLVAFISVPLIVGGSLVYFMQTDMAVPVPVGQLIGGLFVVTLLPVGLGLLLSEKAQLPESGTQLVHRGATTVFVLIVAFTFFNQWPAITDYLPALGPACLLLNLITMATGTMLGAAAKISTRERIALAMECGIQNSALGITLALSMLGQPELAIPSVIYAVLMNATAIVVIFWRRLQPATSAA